MKKVLMFPINIFIYAGKGVKYTFFALTGKNKTESVSNKLVGQELDNELQRVKDESDEFKRNSIKIDDTSRLKEEVKNILFKYTAKASNGSIVRGQFEAETADDVRIFLVNGGYDVVSIEPIGGIAAVGSMNIGGDKISNGDLAFMLTQLSTYIRAGISLIDSVRILSKQSSKVSHKRILDKVVYELVMGQKFSTALERQKRVFPNLLINMVKTAEMTGDLTGTLDEMADYYTETEKTRKQMKSALIYPTVILIFSIAALTFVLLYVVPQFQNMFESNGAELPEITKFILKTSNFMKNNWYFIALGILVVLIIYIFCFKNIKAFRKGMQTIFMKLPVIGNIIIYNEVTNFTRTFSSLLEHNVFITDSMEILSTISNNEIYKEIINRTLIGLSKGNRISDSFRGEWAFPLVAYEMLVTGENTGQLASMMKKVSNYYQELHQNAVSTIKSLIEPIVIVFLAVGVGFIVLSIVIPMFDMYNSIA